MTGRKTAVPRGYRVKDGKLVKVSAARDVSAKIRERKSKRVRVTKGVVK